MEKENEIKMVVPTLRFPEFQDTEGWKEYKLKSLCEIGNGKDYKHLGSGNIPVYGSGGYMTSVDDFLYDGESVCIGRKGTIDKPIFRTGKFWTVDTLFYTHSFHNCLPKFLYLIFLQINWYKYNEAGGVPSLSKTTIGEINVFVPVGKKGELKEQQKIADCLSSLDDLIEATTQKVEALIEHKRGLMQRLFPEEGKNVPDLRFPEFQGMKGWEKKQVKDFGEVITGNTPSKKEEKYWNGDFVWVTAQDFKGKYINDSILKLTKLGKDRARVIPKDSVLVTCIASIGLNAINKVECSTNQQINAICCNQEYNYEYVYYLVTYNTKNLKQLAGQTAVPIITKKSFEEFEVYAIKNYDEQQKIADCLSSLDELIEATSRKVEILKEHKKGLMQQLFPQIQIK